MTHDHRNRLRSYRVTGRNRLGIFAFVPLRRASARSVSHASVKESSGETDRLRVLVIEDEPLLRGMMVAVLSRQGWMVWGAADGKEALQVAEAWRPHVTLVKWMLPGSLTGCSVAEQLRVLLPEVGIIFLTEFPVGPIYPHIRSLAPCALVEKPWEWAELAGAVRRVARVKQDIARWP